MASDQTLLAKHLQALFCGLVFGSGLSMNALAQAEVDFDKIWLPAFYQEHMDLMRSSAELAAKEPDCKQFLRGSLVEDTSTLEAPKFRFICRSEEGETFAIVVDGVTSKVTNPLKELREERDRAQAEKERMQQEQAEAQKLEEQTQYWPICQKAIAEKLVLMQNMVIVSRLPPMPIISMDESFTYSMNFDATSTHGKPLKYRATCIISGLTDYEVKIKPRR